MLVRTFTGEPLHCGVLLPGRVEDRFLRLQAPAALTGFSTQLFY